jgi:hypothetical protein
MKQAQCKVIHTLSSDILAYVCTFLPSDRNVVNLFVCCPALKHSHVLTKVDLKGVYRQSTCLRYKTLSDLYKRIRCWKVLATMDDLPPCLYKLRFHTHFNQVIDSVDFSSCLQELIFGCRFNRPIDNVTFPVTLKLLTFGKKFNQSINNVKFPLSLQQLTFGRNFNQNIDNVTFPVTLQRLTFGVYFDQRLDHIKFPPSLQKLTFGFCFDQRIDNIRFPASLQELIIIGWYNFTRYSPKVPSANVSSSSVYVTMADFKEV